MKRIPLFLAAFSTLALTGPASAQTNNPSAVERFAKPSDALTAAENRFWQRTPLPVPDDIVLEVSGIVAVAPQRLLVTTPEATYLLSTVP